jgi:gamma-glutamylcyclotransferase (GGCT)/AIG2-like uncharacterized protein YtfP
MNVFTYGSLMFPEVWTRVVRGAYRQATASAAGYRRFAVKEETYPGMVAVTDAAGAAISQVEGIVYFDVDAADVSALDEFEGGEYRRTEITIVLPNSERVGASTYLYLPLEKLAVALWLPASFELPRFLEGYCDSGAEPTARDG